MKTGGAVTHEVIDVTIPDLTEGWAAGQDPAHGRSLIEACPDPLIAVGANGRITDVNGAFLRVVAVSREEALGSEFAGYFTDPELARAVHREAFSRGSAAGYPLAILRASNQLTYLLCNAAAYRNGQNEGVVVIARDVTQQKQHQDELAQLNADMLAHGEELKRREAEIKQINDLYEVLQACNSQQEAYPIIGSAAAQLFPQASGALAISVSQTHRMETAAEWGSGARMTASFLLDDCWSLRRGQMQEVAGPGAVQTCRHFQSAPAGGYICLPLSVRGNLQGLLNLKSPLGESLGQRQRQLLTTLGEVIKLSLSSLKLRDALRAQAIRDSLTGLFNRNYLTETLQRELARSARHKAPLCVAMLDIDGFKTFNDTFSHHAGDVLLKALGAFLLKKLRTSDIVCRYGGDEFVLVLPDTDLSRVMEPLDRMRGEVKNLKCIYEGQVLPAASISIGVAQWPDGATSEELINAADKALYSAKHRGRDLVSVFCAEPQDATPAAPDSAGEQSG
jgi:diguanylate cyclase (GGDEF)-like protein/PAS domain S-box-containing protein